MDATPATFETAASTRAEPRPGERWVAGMLYIFNGDLLAQHCAREAMRDLPADLGGFAYDEIEALSHRASLVLRDDGYAANRGRPSPMEDLQVIPITDDLVASARRVLEEKHSRPEYRAAYGGAAA